MIRGYFQLYSFKSIPSSVKQKKVFTFNKSHHVNKKSKTSASLVFYKTKASSLHTFSSWSDIKNFYIYQALSIFSKKITFSFRMKVVACPYSLMVRT